MSNSIVFDKVLEKYPSGVPKLSVHIRLNDECKNGHQDFAITGTRHLKNGDEGAGGAIGNEIAKKYPEFAIFNRLHLCDYKGIPMYPISNGMYLAKSMELDDFAKYYRISKEVAEKLVKAFDKCEYYSILIEEKVFEKWEAEAKEAIAILEDWTNEKFEVDSVRTQLDAPSDEEMNQFYIDYSEGKYTEKAIEEKKKAIIENAFKKKHEDNLSKYHETLKKAEKEYMVEEYFVSVLESLSISPEKDNYIIYDSGEIKLNWRSSSSGSSFSDEEIKQVKDKITEDKYSNIYNAKVWISNN